MTPYTTTQAETLSPGRARPSAVTNTLLAAVWRYRVLVAGLAALGLALWGEQLMRVLPAPTGGSGVPAGANPELGAHLVQIATLLVGLVAWVRDDFRFKFGRGPANAAAAVRTTPAAYTQSAAPAGHSLLARYARLRARAGRWGTIVGLAVVGCLAVTIFILLRGDFDNPYAPWLWLAMLLVLALTFATVRSPSADATLLARDPQEPAIEPPVSRNEWLLVGAIMLAAAILRLWQLASIPIGPYIDESGRALDARFLNQGLPFNHGKFYFFGTGWWGVPSMYFWVVAQSLKVFGDNLLGARMVHAFAGIGTVWFAYRTGRVAWSPRVGLIAAALLAGSDFAIQFSRTAGESTTTLFTWTVCFYFLYKALKTCRPLDFVWCGIAGGLTLYGYASGKLLPVFMVLVALYLLARWGREGMKRYLPGLLLVALAAGLTFAPNLLFIATVKPDALTERSQGVSIFSPANRALAEQQYGTNNLALVLTRQFQTTYAAFDVGQEHGPFYPTGQPILPVPWAALWVLGTAYVVWRVGDARYGVLALWLVGGLAGAALTNDTPTLQRVVGMVPTLGIIPALFMDRVAGGALAAWRERPRVRLSFPARGVRAATNVTLAAIVLLVTSISVNYYFGPYTAAAHYLWPTMEGNYLATLDPNDDIVYASEMPMFNGDPSPIMFTAHNWLPNDMSHLADLLPITDNGGKNVHFMLGQSARTYMGVIESYYPDAQLVEHDLPDGSHVFASLRVSASDIDSLHRLKARYGPPQGPLLETTEPRLGTSGASQNDAQPAITAYPAIAEWTGGLIVPAYGLYTLQLNAPAGGGTFAIDGTGVLTTTSTAPQTTKVVLAKGVHHVDLKGNMAAADTPVELRWGPDESSLVPVANRYLWDGTQGTLLFEAYQPPADDPEGNGWLVSEKPDQTGLRPLIDQLVGFVGTRDVNGTLAGGQAYLARWRGTLNITTGGEYVLQGAGNSRVTMWIDGTLVGAQGIPATSGPPLPTLPAQVNLTPGQHTFELRYGRVPDTNTFELEWQPPNGSAGVIPPNAFAPAAGGVWPSDERPSVGPPNGDFFRDASTLRVSVLGGINADQAWQDGRGLAVLPGGGLAVGDTAAHLLRVYAPGGHQVATSNGTEGGADAYEDISDVAAAPDGTIAVLDGGSKSSIHLYDATGHLIAFLPADKLHLSHGRGLTWGPDGKIYVADTAGNRVACFNRDGSLDAEYRATGPGIQRIEQPVDVAVGSDGQVYAVDLRERVLRFGKDGVADRSWSLPVGFNLDLAHVALWGDMVVVSSPRTYSVAVVDVLGTGSGEVHLLTDSTGRKLTISGLGLDVGQDGRLLLLQGGSSSVAVIGRSR